MTPDDDAEHEEGGQSSAPAPATMGTIGVASSLTTMPA